MSLSVSLFGKTEPELWSAPALRQAVAYGDRANTPWAVRFAGSRFLTVLSSLSMVGDSFRLVGHGAKEAWNHGPVSAESLENYLKAGKCVILAVHALVLGLLLPDAVAWVQTTLDIGPQPTLYETFKERVKELRFDYKAFQTGTSQGIGDIPQMIVRSIGMTAAAMTVLLFAQLVPRFGLGELLFSYKPATFQANLIPSSPGLQAAYFVVEPLISEGILRGIVQPAIGVGQEALAALGKRSTYLRSSKGFQFLTSKSARIGLSTLASGVWAYCVDSQPIRAHRILAAAAHMMMGYQAAQLKENEGISGAIGYRHGLTILRFLALPFFLYLHLNPEAADSYQKMMKQAAAPPPPSETAQMRAMREQMEKANKILDQMVGKKA